MIDAFFSGPKGLRENVWFTSTGHPIIPQKGERVRIKGVDYTVVDVLHDLDVMSIIIYVK